jgi:hypothetical protein
MPAINLGNVTQRESRRVAREYRFATGNSATTVTDTLGRPRVESGTSFSQTDGIADLSLHYLKPSMIGPQAESRSGALSPTCGGPFSDIPGNVGINASSGQAKSGEQIQDVLNKDTDEYEPRVSPRVSMDPFEGVIESDPDKAMTYILSAIETDDFGDQYPAIRNAIASTTSLRFVKALTFGMSRRDSMFSSRAVDTSTIRIIQVKDSFSLSSAIASVTSSLAVQTLTILIFEAISSCDNISSSTQIVSFFGFIFCIFIIASAWLNFMNDGEEDELKEEEKFESAKKHKATFIRPQRHHPMCRLLLDPYTLLLRGEQARQAMPRLGRRRVKMEDCIYKATQKAEKRVRWAYRFFVRNL